MSTQDPSEEIVYSQLDDGAETVTTTTDGGVVTAAADAVVVMEDEAVVEADVVAAEGAGASTGLVVDAEAQASGVQYANVDAMMVNGPPGLHEDLAAKLERSLGKPFPHMQVRVHNLSLTADIVTAHEYDEDNAVQHQELPTLPNRVLQLLHSLWAKKHVVQKHVLSNIDGVFQPGTMTLVLGQSGSGKSALMKVLSGRFPTDKRTRITGDVSYNGLSREALLPRIPQLVSYVTQTDEHFPTMSVRETLEFAHACCGKDLSPRALAHLSKGSDEANAAAVDAARAVLHNHPDIVIRSLGLSDCQETVVGNSMLRGISGGERKRLTTGEMAFGGTRFLTLMDEITTGLDSAAAFDIVHTQRSIARRLHQTVVISLLQPSPELFALFDNVLLLNDGHVMYHGPRESVLAYFASLGLVCPPHRDVADFLCDLGTQQQQQYETLTKCPREASHYADVFRSSEVHAAIVQELEAPLDDELVRTAEQHIQPIRAFSQGFWSNTATVTKRQLLLLWRNKIFLFGRALLVFTIGALFSSVFYKVEMAKVQVVLGMIFASTLFLGLTQASMLTPFMNARAIYYKQRAANFYRTSSYVLANSISQFPVAIAESLLFGSLIYWLGGFVGGVTHFVIFELLVMLSVLVFLALFFFLTAATPNLLICKPVAMVALLLMILFGGFVVTKNEIHDYLIWMYWIDPVAYTVRALAVSQYRSSTYDVCVYKGIDYCKAFGGKTMGEYQLSLFDVPSEKMWVPLGFAFNTFVYVLLMGLSWVVLEHSRHERPEHITIPKQEGSSEDALTDVASVANDTAFCEITTPKAECQIEMGEAERGVPPVTISFKDLWYTVPDPANSGATIDLLKGITGYALPGQITALMGSSGAGKTTLMDVIAGRKTGGTIRGKILLNGFEASDLAIRRCTGYCEQMDIHSEAATFREAIAFSAFLRQGANASEARKRASVDECLELLGMEDIADNIIRGSSMEQHKRLTIGVELAAQPSVLFLDEPTSGLDARSAKVIMDGVRKVADSGRTVLCTIHQPSSDVFYLFDQLLLLKRGGETVYFGPLGLRGRAMVDYFQALPNVHRIPEVYNPATWMLEVIGAGVGGGDSADRPIGPDDVDFVATYAASELKREHLDARITEAGLFEPTPDGLTVSFAQKRAATNWDQFRLLLQRFFRLYWRTPSYNLTRLGVAIFIGVVFGIVYFNQKFKTYQGINSGLGSIFLSLSFFGMVAFISVLPLTFDERAAYYRERASQTYNALWYFLSSTIVEIPYMVVSGLLFTACFFPMVGFRGVENFLIYWLHMTLHILFQSYLGQLLIFCFPTIELGAVVGVLFNATCLLFMGFNPPELEIPDNYHWLYKIIPHRFTLSALVSTMLGECSDEHLYEMKVAAMKNHTIDISGWSLGCQIVQNAPAQVGHVPIMKYIDKVFDIRREDRWNYTAIVLAIIVGFRVFSGFAMRYINLQKR